MRFGSVVEDVTKTAKETDGLSHNKEEEMLVVFFDQVMTNPTSFSLSMAKMRVFHTVPRGP